MDLLLHVVDEAAEAVEHRLVEGHRRRLVHGLARVPLQPVPVGVDRARRDEGRFRSFLRRRIAGVVLLKGKISARPRDAASTWRTSSVSPSSASFSLTQTSILPMNFVIFGIWYRQKYARSLTDMVVRTKPRPVFGLYLRASTLSRPYEHRFAALDYWRCPLEAIR